jgi:hypothetical protein
MTFPICIEVNSGHHFGSEIALGKYNADALIITGKPFHGVGGTGFFVDIAFVIVDLAASHNVFHFGLGNMPALHPAFSMFGIFDIGNAAVESTIAVDLAGRCFVVAGGRVFCGFIRCSPGTTPDKEQQYGQCEYKKNSRPILIHNQRFD